MLPDISIEYYQYDPQLTITNSLIYGRLISTKEDSVSTSTRSTSAPGTATYCSVYVKQETHLEISNGEPEVLKERRFSMPSGERRDFLIGPQESSTVTIAYKEA